ncbi:MAG TPA: hypothetical protein VFT20_03795 [Candidatus Limnocylindrales bacterium]|nr:hypothetical protein [Candidatus Limnocylindrales bacterium]
MTHTQVDRAPTGEELDARLHQRRRHGRPGGRLWVARRPAGD